MLHADLIAAAVMVVEDMGASAGRFARDCDRLAGILREARDGEEGIHRRIIDSLEERFREDDDDGYRH